MREGYEILEGAIDLHIHGLPDICERPFDEIDVIKQAREFGYRAILFKSAFTTNAGRIYVYRKLFDFIEVFGNLTLNLAVGGINPQAVYVAAQLGVKEIKMPSLHAANNIKRIGMDEYAYCKGKNENISDIKGISVLTNQGKLLPQLYDIFDIIKRNDLILGTGHLSREEIMILVEEARNAGVQRILVTHADSDLVTLSMDDQAKLAECGAYLEHTPYTKIGDRRRLKTEEIVANIKRVGAQACVMSTDTNKLDQPSAFENMRRFIQDTLRCGLTEQEIEMMTKSNPARLLGLQ